MKSSDTIALIKNHFLETKDKIFGLSFEIHEELGDVVIATNRTNLLNLLTVLKNELHFVMFLNVTCVDWMDKKDERFEVVYHLLSLNSNSRVRIKVLVPENDPTVDSATSLWAGANFMEREVYDMYGIKFNGHPNLRKILMYEEFVGHPLRKDYPVQGKQPRVKLRYPEVQNTARDMHRDTLVKINRKQNIA